MNKPLILLAVQTHHATQVRLTNEFSEVEAVNAADRAVLQERLPRATVLFGAPPVSLLPQARALRWIQLNSAGVSLDLCDALSGRDVQVTNLAGLYGPTIAEHTLALMLMLARNLQRAQRQQHEQVWRRDLRETMVDLAG